MKERLRRMSPLPSVFVRAAAHEGRAASRDRDCGEGCWGYDGERVRMWGASLDFSADGLRGNEGKMRWITVGAPDQPDTSILLGPPAVDPGVTEDERRTIAEMMAKGTYGWIMLATRDLDGTFERVQAGDAEVVQQPTEQPWGMRDCAFRDPAGNVIRIQELR